MLTNPHHQMLRTSQRANLSGLFSSCSHTRRTVQPRWQSTASTKRSRARLRENLSCQKSTFEEGIVPCFGHECQKHPSTNSTTRRCRNTKSGATVARNRCLCWLARKRGNKLGSAHPICCCLRSEERRVGKECCR